MESTPPRDDFKLKRNELGTDVTYKTEKFPVNTQATGMLNDIGERLTPGGFTYIGSIASHIYVRQQSNIAATTTEFATLEQMSPGNANDQMVMLALQNLTIQLKKLFTGKYATRDPKDLR